MQACRQILHNGARQLYEGYRAYALTTPAAWMQSIDSSSVRQVLPFGPCDRSTVPVLGCLQLHLQSPQSTCSNHVQRHVTEFCTSTLSMQSSCSLYENAAAIEYVSECTIAICCKEYAVCHQPVSGLHIGLWCQCADQLMVLQVLDRAFMSGVLLMTAFWSTATAKQQPNQTATPSTRHNKPQAASPVPAGPAAVAATGNIPSTTASSVAATAGTSPATPTPEPATAAMPEATADHVSGSTSAAVQQTLTAATALQASNSVRGDEQSSTSSQIAAELLDSMSYLQFCRMKLTAYNSLLKNTLTAVSADAQVGKLFGDMVRAC